MEKKHLVKATDLQPGMVMAWETGPFGSTLVVKKEILRKDRLIQYEMARPYAFVHGSVCPTVLTGHEPWKMLVDVDSEETYPVWDISPYGIGGDWER